MTTASKSIAGLNAASAANADQLGELRGGDAQHTDTSGGWDAYDVWRRFIKEARERRERQSDPK